MIDFFSFVFFVGLVKFLWDENKSNVFINLLNTVLVAKMSPPSTGDGISKGVKQLDGSYHVDYMIGGQQYTLVIPPQKRKLKWDLAMAEIEEGNTVEIGSMLKPYAGPHGNFLNLPYSARHLHRGASKIVLMHEGLVVRTIE